MCAASDSFTAARASRNGASAANNASYSRSAQWAAVSACRSRARMEGRSPGIAGRISTASMLRRCEQLCVGTTDVVDVDGCRVGGVASEQLAQANATNFAGMDCGNKLTIRVHCLQRVGDFVVRRE